MPALRNRAEDEATLSDTDLFEVLSNNRRRQVLRCLRQADGESSVGELAEFIAAAEQGTDPSALSSYERKSVYVSLYQNHLPKMAQANVIDYNANRKSVRLLPAASTIESYLGEIGTEPSDRVSVTSLLLIGIIVLLGTYAVGPLTGIPPWVWPVIGIIGLLGWTLAKTETPSLATSILRFGHEKAAR